MATLTAAMLDDLHRGCAAISLLPYSSGVNLATIDFEGADQIFTLKDTFQINQADPTTEEIKIDQGNRTIDVDTETGEFNITGQIPSVATALFDFFYSQALATAAAKGQTGVSYTGKTYFNTPKEVQCSVLVESQSKKTAVGFANVKFAAVMVNDDNSKPLYLKFTGTVLLNSTANQGDIMVYKQVVSGS